MPPGPQADAGTPADSGSEESDRRRQRKRRRRQNHRRGESGAGFGEARAQSWIAGRGRVRTERADHAGLDGRADGYGAQRIIPVEAQGMKMISMGLLNPGDKPVIWRGPMLHSVITQFLRSVEWGELDYLVIDLPPGTGDVQLTLIQTVAVTGAVVVTTPSTVALADVRKAIEMFRQVNVEVLGVVENMSTFTLPALRQAD